MACKPAPPTDPLKSERVPLEKARGVEKTVQDGLDAQNRQEDAAER